MRKVILCCFLGLSLLIACSSNDVEQVAIPIPSDADQIESESFGVEYLYSDSARVTARLEAKHVIEKKEIEQIAEEDPEERLVHYFDQGLLIRFFNIRGQATSTVKANYGVLYKEERIAELKGNVVLDKFSTGERLETEQLFWNQEKDSIYVNRDEFIRITTPEQIITGKGLRTNTAFEPYFIYNVSGQFTVEDGKY